MVGAVIYVRVRHLQSLGISLRSATEPIDDTSTGKLMEGVLAAFAQFDNDVRSDRTRAGMKAALELGRWVFLAPIGYLNAPRSRESGTGVLRTGAASRSRHKRLACCCEIVCTPASSMCPSTAFATSAATSNR
jgi:DNA invertase Pin-like site-specific DNA recombinase